MRTLRWWPDIDEQFEIAIKPRSISNSDDATMADNINSNAEDRLHLHCKWRGGEWEGEKGELKKFTLAQSNLVLWPHLMLWRQSINKSYSSRFHANLNWRETRGCMRFKVQHVICVCNVLCNSKVLGGEGIDIIDFSCSFAIVHGGVIIWNEVLVYGLSNN